MEIRLPLDDGTAVRIDCSEGGTARVFLRRGDNDDELYIGTSTAEAIAHDLSIALAVGPDVESSGDSHRLGQRMFWGSWDEDHIMLILGNESEFFVARLHLTTDDAKRWQQLLDAEASRT